MTLKLVINEHWNNLPAMIDEMKRVWNEATGNFPLDIIIEETSYQAVPFQEFADSNGQPTSIVDREWYKREITPKGWGYDIVTFVLPWHQYPGKSIGGITNWNAGRYEIEVAANENQMYPWGGIYWLTNSLIHELSHALKQMYRVTDDTHSHFWLEHFDPKSAFSFLKTKKMNQVKIVKSKHTSTVYLCYPVPSEQHLKERSNLEGFEVPAQIPTSDVL